MRLKYVIILPLLINFYFCLIILLHFLFKFVFFASLFTFFFFKINLYMAILLFKLIFKTILPIFSVILISKIFDDIQVFSYLLSILKRLLRMMKLIDYFLLASYLHLKIRVLTLGLSIKYFYWLILIQLRL